MTRIADRATKLRAETSARVQGRPLCLFLGTVSLIVRQKGRRHGYEVPYEAIWSVGAKIQANEDRRAREEKRKGR